MSTRKVSYEILSDDKLSEYHGLDQFRLKNLNFEILYQQNVAIPVIFHNGVKTVCNCQDGRFCKFISYCLLDK